MIIPGVPQAFLDLCKLNVEVPIKPESHLSRSSTLYSPTAPDFDKLKDKVDHARLTKNYADAYTDNHGLRCDQGFIVKTGPAWPKPSAPNARPFRRELRAVNGHRIAPAWDDILTRIEVCIKGAKLPFTAVMPLGFANVDEQERFCPLLVAIGVEPKKVTYEDAKAVSESVKLNILAEAGFDDVEVAIWEFETFLSSSGPKLPALDPELQGHLTEFYHAFTSTLGIAVAPLKQPGYEGSLGLFLTRGDDSKLLALTAAHVARPPWMFPDNKGLSLKAADMHNEDIVMLGYEANTLAVEKIQSEVGRLQQSIKNDEQRIVGLQVRLNNGAEDADGITTAIRTARQNVDMSKESIRQLAIHHGRVTGLMPIPDNRCIARVLFADPIGASSDGPDAHTQDWAVLGIRKDAFGDDFQGNILYIGDKLGGQAFLDRMFPHYADRDGYVYPEHGLLRFRGVVPMEGPLRPKQRDAKGDPAMAVAKNSRTTGTTTGWYSELKSLVRYYKFINVEFTSRELTIVPYDNKPGTGAFSDRDDSGAAIVDRDGRVVALLTGGGGGISDATDVTFASPYCEVEKRMKEIFPGIRLLE